MRFTRQRVWWRSSKYQRPLWRGLPGLERWWNWGLCTKYQSSYNLIVLEKQRWLRKIWIFFSNFGFLCPRPDVQSCIWFMAQHVFDSLTIERPRIKKMQDAKKHSPKTFQTVVLQKENITSHHAFDVKWRVIKVRNFGLLLNERGRGVVCKQPKYKKNIQKLFFCHLENCHVFIIIMIILQGWMDENPELANRCQVK